MIRSLASTRIGYTTILEHMWMAGLKRMVSGRRCGINWFLCPSNTMTCRLAGSEINLLRFFRWNLTEFGISNGTRRGDRFQTVILQRVSGVSGSRNICDRIDSRLHLWNKDSCNELVQDSHRAAEEALGNKLGTQTQEQHHCNFSKLVLKGTLCGAVRFICERETGGFC